MPQTRPKRLSASFVRTVKRPGRYGDGHGGHGLSLLVKPRAHGGVAKSWSQRMRINGKPCNVGLGPFPIVNLAEAREAALENARAVYQGHDPRKGSATAQLRQGGRDCHRDARQHLAQSAYRRHLAFIVQPVRLSGDWEQTDRCRHQR